MPLDSKFGFVAFLDAIGTRTLNLDNAKKYLQNINNLQKEIDKHIDRTLKKVTDKNLRIYFKDLKPRFFGDSILITYEVKDKKQLEEYLKRIIFVLTMFIPATLVLGIPMRGALAIGEFIEESGVALGPAVYDAASWYEKQDMISVMATPKTTINMKGLFSQSKIEDLRFVQWEETKGVFIYDVPTKDSTISSYVVDWPQMIPQAVQAKEKVEEKVDSLKWFYNFISSFEMPFGTELKYTNTESLIKYSIKLNSEKRGMVLD